MEQRFSGQIMQRAVDPAARQATLGEIGINQFAPYLMNRIMERWNGNLAEALKLHNMSTTMMRALAVLSISSPVTINELSAYAVTEQSTMSRTLDILEAQGLVRRQRRAEDMRIRDVSITEEGRAAFERVWPMMHARFQTLFDGVDEEEYRAFTATLLMEQRGELSATQAKTVLAELLLRGGEREHCGTCSALSALCLIVQPCFTGQGVSSGPAKGDSGAAVTLHSARR